MTLSDPAIQPKAASDALAANHEPATPRHWPTPRFGYYANTFMLWLGLRFLWIGYVFVWFAALYFFICVPKARRASIRYLDLIHAGTPRGFFRRCWQTYRHMVVYGILLLDRALMLARPGHGFAMDCEGLENLARAGGMGPRPEIANPSGIILLTAHFGMAETAAPYIARMGLHKPMHIVMYQDPRDGTERFHARHRHMLNKVSVISTIDPLAAGVKIIAALRKGDFVAMRADRTLAGKGVPVTLLGKPLLLPAGPFVAAALSNAPVLYVYTCRLGYRRYRCIISAAPSAAPDPEISRDQRIARSAQAFATHLETILRRYPCQWSNFYDLWQVQQPAA